jgi:tetratricopeptide (TPR) repeat protein
METTNLSRRHLPPPVPFAMPVSYPEEPTGVLTDQVAKFDAGELFGDGEHERTVITALPFDLKPRFTGRTAPIDRLESLFDHSRDTGALGFALVIGEPGMGKSRLCAELATRVKAKHPGALVIAGAADDSGVAYGVIARALATRFGFLPGEAETESRDRVQAGVAEVMSAARVPEVAHLVAHLMRVPFDDSPVVAPLVESPQRLETRMFMAVRRFLAAEAERRPLLLVLENLELCGQESINLIQYLVAGLAQLQVTIVATATAALLDRHPAFGEGDVPLARIDLGALTADEAEGLARELLRPLDEVPRKLLDHARTLGGSPRAIHELVRYLLESDCIVRGGGASWRVDPIRMASVVLPRTYDQLVAARLAVMDPAERRVLEIAAAIGEVAWLDAIIAVDRGDAIVTRDPDGPTLAEIASSGDHSRLAVSAALGKLIEREWLIDVRESSVPGERELRFAYPNLWTLVHRGIDGERRRTFHACAARWLELRPEGRGPSAQEEIARHLELAGDTREAAQRYRRAAEAARQHYQNERAIRLFDRALACVGASDVAARIHLWHDLGSVYEMIGDFEAALGAFERMLRLSWIVASKTKAAVAFNKMGRVWRRKGDLKLALEYLERGLELFRTAEDGRGIAGSLDDIGRTEALLGRYDDAFARITEGLTRRGKTGDTRSIAASLSNLGNVQQARGQFEAAFNCHKEALELRVANGDRWGVIVSRNNLAVLAFEQGDTATARQLWHEGLTAAESIGALPLSALLLTNLGELALRDAKAEEARSRLEDALEIIEDIEDRQLEAECCRHLATLELDAGHAVAAQELAERAVAVAAKAGIKDREALAHLTLGQVLSAALFDTDGDGQIAKAESHFRIAVDTLREIGNDGELAKALELYGRFQVERGDISGGRDTLRDALAVFTRIGLGKRGQDVGQLLASLD